MIDTEAGRIRHQFAAIADTVVHQLAETIDKECRWPSAAFEALKAERLTGLIVPMEYGGMGQGLFSMALACETLGEKCGSTAICFGMHCVGSGVISVSPTKHQIENYLRPIADGEHITTLSLSEPGTGAHFYFPQTGMELIGEHYEVNGEKTFVTNGKFADSYVLSGAEFIDGSSTDNFSCMILDNKTEGMEWHGKWEGMGMRGNSSISLKLNNVQIPMGNLLGKAGDQIWYVFHVVAPYFLTSMSGCYLGIANAALNIAVEHINKRNHSHNGQSLGQSDVIQHRLGEIWARVERTRQLVYSAAKKFDADDPHALLSILSAKAEVADCTVDTVNDVMTLCGGIGYRDGGKLQRLLRDARAAHVMAPTTDLLRIWTGRGLLGIPLLSE